MHFYVHIPFCESKCGYCDFNSYAGMEDLFDPFLEALKREVALMAPSFQGLTVESLYIGGGTPTLLGGARIQDLVFFFRDEASFSPRCEITVEANPGTVSPDTLRILQDSGVNRLSLGAQTFDDRLLGRLGRLHTRRDILNAVRWAREAGFDNLSMDLMFGLPEQTSGDWRRELMTAYSLRPEHISAYQLTVETGTEFGRPAQSRGLNLPDERIVEEMHRITPELMSAAGYQRYEISNYARDGKYCRHNANTWRYGEYLGFGAGASSFREGVRSRNANRVRDYVDRARRGLACVAEEERAEGGTRVAEMIMLGLRTAEGVDMGDIEHRTRVRVREVYSGLLADLEGRGLVNRAGDQVRLTDRGVLFSNEVFLEFL